MPEIRHLPEAKRFELLHDNKLIGELDYTVSGNRMNMAHTRVSPEFTGQGLARRLVDAALAFAGAQGWEAEASCSYAHSVLNRLGQLSEK